MSTTAAAIAARAGYTNSRVMLAGIDGWAENGYPTYADDRLVNKGNRILIDVRTADKNKAERIAGSVSIPAASLAARIGTLSKKAPVIVYSDNNKESLAALAEFREAGFNKVSMVEGNIQGWKKRDNPVSSGPVITEINWTRKTLRGEVSPAAFSKALNHRANALVLDVRTSEETTAGRLDGATLLPLNELYDRMEELPKDRAIYIYSATGARAEMAARLLKRRGYNVYFLVADISCQGGTCEMAF
jgi:rhodanese-related sulfurtransferase